MVVLLRAVSCYPSSPCSVTRVGALSRGWLRFGWDMAVPYKLALFHPGILTQLQPQGHKGGPNSSACFHASVGGTRLVNQTPSKVVEG